jgi:geranylgeranyl pyrophosphate synthase
VNAVRQPGGGVRERYADDLLRVDEALLGELTNWSWDDLGPLAGIVEAQVRRGGKRLRPLLLLALTRALARDTQDTDRAVAPAAAVEFYHLAAIVLDDVQDQSAVRRGAPSVHAAAGPNTAINVAATIRSLSYHPIHRSVLLGDIEKHALHRELDEAATRLVLGQSIDIGWNQGWYPAPADFPYARMVRWKSGSLFGCAAAMAALVARMVPAEVDAARRFGVALGSLFQLVDDYLDAFGADGVLRRERFEDFRGGKLSAPVVFLLRALHQAGRGDEAEGVRRRLAGDAVRTADWSWLLALMREYAVADSLRAEVDALVGELGAHVVGRVRVLDTDVRDLVDLIVAPTAHPPIADRRPTAAPGPAGP